MEELDRLAARCVFIGIQGTQATPAELDLVRRGVGGVVLFRRNVESPQQVAELSRTLKSAAPGPLLLCIDQEGGRVQRLSAPHWTALPPFRRIGQIDAEGGLAGQRGEQVAERVAKLIAQELNACGLDLDFAPVLDVDTNPRNPVIGDRALSNDEQRVARLGIAFAKALEANGIASCAKHFPGHGDTLQDSHHTLPRQAHDLEQLWKGELVPFMAAARAGLASVMTAHVVFESIDSLPATLSEKMLRLLRREIGFAGCVISDDLEMKAIADTVGVLEAGTQAISVGCDAVLVCHSRVLQAELIEALSRAARAGPLSRERLLEASGRVEALQRKFAKAASAVDPARAASLCGTEESRAFAHSLNVPTDVAAAQAARTAQDPTEWRGA